MEEFLRIHLENPPWESSPENPPLRIPLEIPLENPLWESPLRIQPYCKSNPCGNPIDALSGPNPMGLVLDQQSDSWESPLRIHIENPPWESDLKNLMKIQLTIQLKPKIEPRTLGKPGIILTGSLTVFVENDLDAWLRLTEFISEHLAWAPCISDKH